MHLRQLWHDSKAVLFDFDGVLADSEPFYRISWNTVLAEYGHTVPEEIYWKHWSFLGEGLEGEIARTGIVVPSPESARRRQQDIYRRMCMEGSIPLFTDAARVVGMVMGKKPCAIASNTASDLVRTLAGREIKPMPPIVGGEGLPAKPAPDIFLRAAEVLRVRPEECLVFEDAMKGIRAASAAGMKAVLVRNRYNRTFDGTGASCEVHGLEEITELVKEN